VKNTIITVVPKINDFDSKEKVGTSKNVTDNANATAPRSPENHNKI